MSVALTVAIHGDTGWFESNRFRSVRFDLDRCGSGLLSSARIGSINFGSDRIGSIRSGWDRSDRFNSFWFGSVQSGSVGIAWIGSIPFGSDRFNSTRLGSIPLGLFGSGRFYSVRLGSIPLGLLFGLFGFSSVLWPLAGSVRRGLLMRSTDSAHPSLAVTLRQNHNRISQARGWRP